MLKASAQDFMQIPLKRVVMDKGATPPMAPVSGQFWTDTTVSPPKVRWFDGTNWVAADGTSIPPGYITDSLISPTAGIQLSKLATDPLARANHTGVQLASTISDFNTAVRTNRLDQLAVPQNPVDVSGQRISNLATPTLANDAANKTYVDNARAGLAGVKDPVRVAATGNVTISAPGAALDGVNLANGDRFLAPVQNTATESGIWVFNGAATPATRPVDADALGEVQDGTMVAVSDGSKAGYQYIQTATPSGAPGSWTQTWIVFQTGGQTYTAGNGLTLAGTTFALDAPVSIANGGTGASTAFLARFNLNAPGRYTGALPALVAGATATITHGLNVATVIPAFFQVSDSRAVDIDYACTSATVLTLYPDSAWAAGTLKCLILG